MDKPNFYSILPAKVRYSEELSWFAKILYAEITALASKDGYCFAKNSYFAECFDVSERQVRRAISDLARLGFVRAEIENGNERRIYISGVLTFDENESGKDSPEEKTTPDKNVRADKNVMGDGQKCPPLVDSTSKEDRVNNNINNKYNIYLAVLKFLNDTCKTAYKPCAKNKRHIMARLNEGYSLEDFQRVITDRHELWASDTAMCRYLRPETLFGSKFQGYLEAAKIAAEVKNKSVAAKQARGNEDAETQRKINERLEFMQHRKKRQKAAHYEA